MSKRRVHGVWLAVAVAVAAGSVGALRSSANSDAAGGICEVRAAEVQVAQADTCRSFNQSCGTAVTQGPSACCGGFWCQNGTCVKFRQANEPCGNGNPPCASGLSCSDGRCH